MNFDPEELRERPQTGRMHWLNTPPTNLVVKIPLCKPLDTLFTVTNLGPKVPMISWNFIPNSEQPSLEVGCSKLRRY